MYFIKIARISFKCPMCGFRVRIGDSYVKDEEGKLFCYCVLPKRKLIPLNLYRNGEEIAVKSN